jgi:hypothetical protein
MKEKENRNAQFVVTERCREWFRGDQNENLEAEKKQLRRMGICCEEGQSSERTRETSSRPVNGVSDQVKLYLNPKYTSAYGISKSALCFVFI